MHIYILEHTLARVHSLYLCYLPSWLKNFFIHNIQINKITENDKTMADILIKSCIADKKKKNAAFIFVWSG